jgi:predicted RNA-binding protein with PUA-like domain
VAQHIESYGIGRFYYQADYSMKRIVAVPKDCEIFGEDYSKQISKNNVYDSKNIQSQHRNRYVDVSFHSEISSVNYELKYGCYDYSNVGRIPVTQKDSESKHRS